MTEQLMTITGLEFTENGRIIARGTVIREGEYDLPALLAAGGAQMGALRPMNGCRRGGQRQSLPVVQSRQCSSGSASCWRRRTHRKPIGSHLCGGWWLRGKAVGHSMMQTG